mgnify:FL=1
MVNNTSQSKTKLISVILLTVVLIVGVIFGYTFLKKDKKEVAKAPTWHKKVSNLFADNIYASTSNPKITNVETEGLDPEEQYAYPIFLFNGNEYNEKTDKELFAKTLTQRKNMVASINDIIESMLIPNKSTETFVNAVPKDSYTSEFLKAIPTEAQKKKFSNVVIKEKNITLNVNNNGEINTSFYILGDMKYSGKPAEFQYSLEIDTKDGKINTITHLSSNSFGLNINNTGYLLINEIP